MKRLIAIIILAMLMPQVLEAKPHTKRSLRIDTVIAKAQKKVRNSRIRTRQECIQSKQHYITQPPNGWPFRFLD